MFKIKLMGDDVESIKDVEFSIYQHAVTKYKPQERSFHMGTIFRIYWQQEGFDSGLGWILYHTKKTLTEDPAEKSKFEKSLKDFNFLVYIYDITKPETFEGLKFWLELEGHKNAEKIILGTNIENEKERKISKEVAEKFAEESAASYFEVEASEGKFQTNNSVKKLMKALREKAEDQQEVRIQSFLNVLNAGGVDGLIDEVINKSDNHSLETAEVLSWIVLQKKFLATLQPRLLEQLTPLIEMSVPEVKRVMQIIFVYCAKVNSSSNEDVEEDVERENKNITEFLESLSECKELTESTLKKVYEKHVTRVYMDVYINLKTAHPWFIEPQVEMKTAARKEAEEFLRKEEQAEKIAAEERREKEEDEFLINLVKGFGATNAESGRELRDPQVEKRDVNLRQQEDQKVGVAQLWEASELKASVSGVKKEPEIKESDEDESSSLSKNVPKENLQKFSPKVEQKAIEILGKSAFVLTVQKESPMLVGITIFPDEWDAFVPPPEKGEGLAQNVLNFVATLYEDKKDSDFELNVSALHTEVQKALRNLLAYAGELQGEYNALAADSKDESLGVKLGELRVFMRNILEQEDLTTDSLQQAYDDFQKNDKNRGSGFYRVHSFFHNKRYDGWHLVKSTSGELAYNLMEALKKHPQSASVDDGMDEVRPD